MFESISEKFDRAFKLLKGQGRITEINVAETLKDVRKALLDADVNFKIAKTFTEQVKEKALGANVLTSLSPGQLMVKITHDELVKLMGGEMTELNLKGSPAIILIAGLQGSGKTTFAAKLAGFVKSKKGRNPLLVACDVYRPAAINQLKVLGEQIGVNVYADETNNDPVSIAKKALTHARDMGYNPVIIDTAGRLAIDEQMMDEIANIKKAVNPQETLFVVDSMTGQDAVNTAKAFNDRLDYEGVVLTKLDGDTRGGAALSIKSVVDKPIKFVGVGEKLDAIDIFYPERMADRILGMGDIVSFVEKAQENFDEIEQQKIQRKILKDQFTMNDYLGQLMQVKKMGNMKEVMSMIPGIGKAMKNVEIPDDIYKNIEAIVGSMTPAERENPDILNGSRRKRIASGSGTDIMEVNKVIKQFDQTRMVMKEALGGNKAKAIQMMKNQAKKRR